MPEGRRFATLYNIKKEQAIAVLRGNPYGICSQREKTPVAARRAAVSFSNSRKKIFVSTNIFS